MVAPKSPVRPPAAAPAPAPANAVRHLGRFQLLRLVGKSARTMVWLVSDPRVNQELLLMLPRSQPASAAAMAQWLDNARRASRIDHPGLAHVVEVGEHDRWPFMAYDRGNAVTLAEKLSSKGFPGTELVPWASQALQGLAFAHEAGLAHHDIQVSSLLVSDTGTCRLMGLGVALEPDAQHSSLQDQRVAAERDVLALGLVLHHALAGVPALEQPDVNVAIERMPPLGREIVRLPWNGVHRIPEPLRVIVNRATDRQERQRYRSARTLERALSGWLKTDGEPGGGPIVLLLDRLRTVGLLPAMPGGAARADHLMAMERERTNELAEIVLQDVGLTFELMRSANGVKARGAMGAGSGPILTVRRALAMLGLDGVRRAANSLRAWPGPLNDGHAIELENLLEQVKLAGRVAQWFRPAGYDPELVYLLALLQNLGRLVVQYHFPEEAAQIRRLMQPAAPAKQGDPEDPGMSEEAAAFAVLGVDIDALGAAVVRHWGLDESVLQMMRRIPVAAPVHHADTDGELLRLSASFANEVVDARTVPPHHRQAFMQRVVQRYGRQLGISLQDVVLAAQGIAPSEDDPEDGADSVGVGPHGAARRNAA